MHAGQLVRSWRLREHLGPVYGSEDLSLLLYALARREKWANIVELGTGLGVCTVWLGRAVKENGRGHVHSVDDGSHFRTMPSSVRRRALRAVTGRTVPALSYDKYLDRIEDLAGVADRITHYDHRLDFERLEQLSSSTLPFLATPIDMLFADINHGRDAVVAILRRFLPAMSRHASIFIDGASRYPASRRLLGQLVTQLNRARVPGCLSEGLSPRRARRLGRLVRSCRFTLTDLIERKQRPQNNTTWLRIAPAPRGRRPTRVG